ncbi:MAG: amidohydrolase [Cellvibrionaceae bacterium]
MKAAIKALLVLLVILSITVTWLLSPEKPPAKQAFINAKVLTMNTDNAIEQAVFIERDRIVAVGSNDDIQALIDDDTQLHDLGGRTLMPGFVDAHGHFPGSGLGAIAADVSSPPVGNVDTVEQLQQRLREQAQNTPAGEWVLGFGYDDTLLQNKQHPTKQQLDAVSTEHPVYILHVSGHMGVANSVALETIGYDKNTQNPEGGVIVKDAAGELTGLLEETAHEPFVVASLDMSLPNFYRLLTSAVDEYASMGVTTAQSGGVDMTTLKALSSAQRFGLIPFRLELWPFDDKMGDAIRAGEVDLSDYNSDKVRTKTVKIVADGSIQGFTGYLAHPYHTPFRGDDQYRGYPIMAREKLVEKVVDYQSKGFQMAIHGNGDAAIDDIIYAFDQAQQKHPIEDPRLILIHSQMARDDQLADMKRLGITPSFFSAHTYYWGDRHRDIFMGPERAMRMSPTRSAKDIDLRYSVHLDTPVVPMTPLLMVWSTANRLSSNGHVIGEAQTVPVMDALRAVTIDAAWQVFRDKELGSIEEGKLADIIVIDGDPLVDPINLRNLQVDQTFVGGVNIFSRDTAQ